MSDNLAANPSVMTSGAEALADLATELAARVADFKEQTAGLVAQITPPGQAQDNTATQFLSQYDPAANSFYEDADDAQTTILGLGQNLTITADELGEAEGTNIEEGQNLDV